MLLGIFLYKIVCVCLIYIIFAFNYLLIVEIFTYLVKVY